jgi:hypothetical protein
VTDGQIRPGVKVSAFCPLCRLILHFEAEKKSSWRDTKNQSASARRNRYMSHATNRHHGLNDQERSYLADDMLAREKREA